MQRQKYKDKENSQRHTFRLHYTLKSSLLYAIMGADTGVARDTEVRGNIRPLTSEPPNKRCDCNRSNSIVSLCIQLITFKLRSIVSKVTNTRITINDIFNKYEVQK